MSVTKAKSNGRAVGVGPVTNGAERLVELSAPYTVAVTIRGNADLLFHRWNVEAVAEKAAAAKGSKAKKSDDIESYVWRDDSGDICLPGEYLRGALVSAAKFRQDPRSPRKSAADLFKAAVVSMTPLASLGAKGWDYEHKARVMVQRNGVTRVRPAMKAGWQATVDLMVTLPAYVTPDLLHDVLTDAGKLIGVGDFRPSYGRFQVVRFEDSRG